MFKKGNFKRINGDDHSTSRNEKAQGMVEFALVLPMLLLLMFGIIEMGRLILTYSAVYTASREAARYGSASGDVSGTPRFADCSGIAAAARRVGALADITSVNVTYDYGADSIGNRINPDLNCPPSQIVSGGRSRVFVTVSANFQPILPLVNIPQLTITTSTARTILSNLNVGNPALPGLHVNSLSGTGVLENPANPGNSKWTASVAITVYNQTDDPIANAVVTGNWGGGGNVTCTTNGSGVCNLSKTGINKNTDYVQFTVTAVTGTGYLFHDIDSDTATSVCVPKPGKSCP